MYQASKGVGDREERKKEGDWGEREYKTQALIDRFHCHATKI